MRFQCFKTVTSRRDPDVMTPACDQIFHQLRVAILETEDHARHALRRFFDVLILGRDFCQYNLHVFMRCER